MVSPIASESNAKFGFFSSVDIAFDTGIAVGSTLIGLLLLDELLSICTTLTICGDDEE
jgi:hypothetical protein